MRFRRREAARPAPPEAEPAEERRGDEPSAPAAGAALELTHAELERLVAASAEAHPDRAGDWRWYVEYLRDRADPEGRIPAEYRLLLRLVYGDLPGMPDL